MSLDNQDKVGSIGCKDTAGRRSFIKKASAGAILTSLPAQSVWARGGNVCTASGAMSGNMSGIERHKDCEKPSVPIGCGPDVWKDCIKPDLSKCDGKNDDGVSKLHNRFSKMKQFQDPDVIENHTDHSGHSGKHSSRHGSYGSGSRSRNDVAEHCYDDGKVESNKRRVLLLEDIQLVCRNSVMSPNSELVNSEFEPNILNALSKSGSEMDCNLAAVWLNVYYNFGSFSGGIGQTGTANNVVNGLLAYFIINARQSLSFAPQDGDYGFSESAQSDFDPSDWS